jgi:hypothetical protein
MPDADRSNSGQPEAGGSQRVGETGRRHFSV